MLITKVTFTRKVNTGSFESFDISATADVLDTEPLKVAENLQLYVDQLCDRRMDLLRRPGRRGGVDAGEFPEL